MYEFHSDSRHGWLKVPLAHIDVLGVEGISGFSYKDKKHAYLEEDCDADKFINAYKNSLYEMPEIKEVYDGDISNIRAKNHYE